MITITEADEHALEERLRTTLMLADEREALTQALAAIRKARAEGGRFVHVVINGARWPTIRLGEGPDPNRSTG